MNLDSSTWGPPFWKTLHTICHHYPLQPNSIMKKKMYDLSDAFIVLPGGIGTLEEFAEVVTWKVLGIQNKKIFLINIGGYYDFLLKQFSVIKENNFLYTDIFQDIIIINKIEELKKHL